MFSCLGRIGCLFFLLIAAVVAWLTRERWQARVFGDSGSPVVEWQPLDQAGAERAEAAVARLGRAGGPGMVTMTPSELASSLFAFRGGMGLPASLDSIFAAVEGDRIRVRALVPLDEIRGLDALGSLGGLLDKHEPIELSGTIEVVRPGLGQYRVMSVSVADLALPQAAIPALLSRLYRDARPEGLAPDGIGIAIPEHIGDVRVARGTITLYRGTP